DHVERFHRAGADFALSLGEVAGEILAHKLLGEAWISLETRIKLVEVAPIGLEGRMLSDTNVGAKTGCSVVAVERDEQVIVDFSDDFVPASGDRVHLCGSEEAIARYYAVFPGARSGS
nr:TrkA C-terminal domain-containing protein [Deltaproteobacteria bacterium]